MFKTTDHSAASFYVFVTFAVLTLPVWLYTEISVFLFRKGRSRAKKNMDKKKIKSKIANFMNNQKVLLIWILSTLLFGVLILYFVVFKSCSNIDVTLMEPHGFPKNDGECQYQKTSVCFHELLKNMDSYLYKDPGSCDNKRFDFMDSSEIRKKIEKTKPGSTIAAWPLWEFYKNHGYEFPTYL